MKYFECEHCGSLQTEKPYWLKAAYDIPGVHIDVGQAARVLQTWLRLCFLLDALKFSKQVQCIDYGGSAGLLTRLMRDSGYDYFAFDTYDSSKYANYFKVDQLNQLKPRLITAFEVFEHFPEPASSLAEILETATDLIVFSTQFYEGQGPEWDYLVPFCGQHIFFFRERALSEFCENYGYALRRTRDFSILVNRHSSYLSAVEAISELAMTPEFATCLVTKLGWGTESTMRDHAYAQGKFQRDLMRLQSAQHSHFYRLIRRIRNFSRLK